MPTGSAQSTGMSRIIATSANLSGFAFGSSNSIWRRTHRFHCRLCSRRKRNRGRSYLSCQSALFIDFGGDTARRHRSRPAGIEREVSNNLSYLVFRDAVVERPAEMTFKLLGSVSGDQCRYDDQASVPLAEPGSLPDVAIYDLLRELDHLRHDTSDAFTCRIGPLRQSGSKTQPGVIFAPLVPQTPTGRTIAARLKLEARPNASFDLRAARSVAPPRTACMFEADHHRDLAAGQVKGLRGNGICIELIEHFFAIPMHILVGADAVNQGEAAACGT